MHLLIAAAGVGRRMGSNRNKLLLPLLGRPLLAWTLDAAMTADSIEWVGIIGQPVDKDIIMSLLSEYSKPTCWINGGDTRQESVRCGLAALPKDSKNVLIHDGARCLIEPSTFNRCAKAVESGFSVIAAVPVTDTIKIVDNAGFTVETPNRSELWAAQTPQGFSVEELKEAHSIAISKAWEVTDDASIYEQLNWPVKIIESSPSNIKVTTPFDLCVAEAIISKRATSLESL